MSLLRKVYISLFFKLFSYLSSKAKIIDLSLASDFNDFEDAIQFYTALESNLHVIITRNKKDFKNNLIPVFSAKEFLKK